jgi:hypothetical protein
MPSAYPEIRWGFQQQQRFCQATKNALQIFAFTGAVSIEGFVE